MYSQKWEVLKAGLIPQFLFLSRGLTNNLQVSLRLPLHCTITAAVWEEVRSERRGGWQAEIVAVEGSTTSTK